MIDENLSWKFHIDAVATKISNIVSLIAKLRHFSQRRVLLNIYQELIQPYLTYGLASRGVGIAQLVSTRPSVWEVSSSIPGDLTS